MHKNELNALCLLCEKDGETIEHFILDCEQLKEVREPIIQEIDSLERLQIELEKKRRIRLVTSSVLFLLCQCVYWFLAYPLSFCNAGYEDWHNRNSTEDVNSV
jgi:hypothetical protein